MACHDCDLLQRVTPLAAGGAALCRRCGGVLYRYNPGNRERVLALTVTAALLFLISNLYPIVGIESQGNRSACTLLGAVYTLWQDHWISLALLVLVTTVLAPALEVVALLVLMLQASPSPWLLRGLQRLSPWAMVEVFMLGLLVSVQKLSHLARIEPGVALWSFSALMVVLAALTATFNPRDLWRSVPLEGRHHG